MSLVKRIKKIDHTLTLAYRTRIFSADWDCETKVVYAEFAEDFYRMSEEKRVKTYTKAMRILEKHDLPNWHSIAKGLNDLFGLIR